MSGYARSVQVLTAGSSTGGRVASVALTWYARKSLADLVS
jgi:hypothetical protein